MLNVNVKFDGNSYIAGSSASKAVKWVEGNVKNPLKINIPLRNGKPDIDSMTGNFALGDESMTYTLNKSQI